jgi:hypothetical protein
MKKLIFLLLISTVLISCSEKVLTPVTVDDKIYTFTENRLTGHITMHTESKDIAPDWATIDGARWATADKVEQKNDERIATLREHSPYTIIGDRAYIITDFEYRGCRYRMFQDMNIENTNSFFVERINRYDSSWKKDKGTFTIPANEE